MRNTMLHTFTTVVAAATLGLAAGTAQAQLIRVDGAPASPPSPAPKVHALTVSPAGQPEPALRYLLLPDLPDTTPGNAALLYQAAIELGPARDKGDPEGRIAEWLALPIDQVPRKDAEEAVGRYAGSLRHVELAARRERCDWEHPFRSEGIGLLLPGLGRHRELARVLSLRARLHIAAGRYDDAVRDLQTGYAMGRHVAEGGTLIEALVGLAVAGLMNETTMELMQSKDGPNLYWALSSLPRPFISVRKSLEYERNWIVFGANLGLLRKAAYGDRLTPEEGAALPGEMSKIWALMLGAQGGDAQQAKGRTSLSLAAIGIKVYPIAKKHLAEKGLTPEQIEKMPVAQAVAVYTMGRYFHWRDEAFKWHSLPFHQAVEGHARAAKALAQTQTRMEEGWPFTTLLPSLGRAAFQGARGDRRLCAMQTIEAVRLWAAAHDGKAPASLDELKEFPPLSDPVAGRPFEYERTESGFILHGPAPKGFRPEDGDIYKVTFRK